MARKSPILVCTLLLCLILCPVAIFAFASNSSGASLGSPPPVSIKLSQEMPRDIALDYSSSASANAAEDTLRTIIRDKPSLNALTVGRQGYEVSANWTLLAEAIGTAQDLAELHWESYGYMPRVVLSALETEQSDCKLYFSMSFYEDSFQPEHNNILGHPNLYALKTSIWYGGVANEHDMALVQQILETCPNLRKLDLSVSWGGCVIAWPQPYAFDFTKSTKGFPPLSSLRLNGYRLDDKVNGGEWMEWESRNPPDVVIRWPWNLLSKTILDWIGMTRLRLIGGIDMQFVKRDSSPLPEMTPINLDAWLERMDWSHLTHLELDSASPTVLQKLAPVLTNLTSFSVGYAVGEELREFIAGAQRPLELISIRRHAGCNSLGQFISDIAIHHGSALESLTLLGPYLNVSHVAKLRGDCSKLETLDINVGRVVKSLENDTWTFDYDFLNAVASVPMLKHLNLRFESADDADIRLGAHDGAGWGFYDARRVDPLVNQTSVEDLFKYLNGQRQRLGLERLQTLDIIVGNWDGRHDSYLGGPPRRLLGRWKCQECDGSGNCTGGNMYPSYYGSWGVEEPFVWGGARVVWDQDADEF